MSWFLKDFFSHGDEISLGFSRLGLRHSWKQIELLVVRGVVADEDDVPYFGFAVHV